MKHFEYKNFIGEYSYIEEDKEYYGNVLGVDYIIGFCGDTEEELIKDFIVAIDEHLNETGESGSFSEKIVLDEY